MAYSRVLNRRGGRNKQGSSQILAKIINGKSAINREAGKNTAIRHFIEIKSRNDLLKISTKKHNKYKGSLSTWRITSKQSVYAFKRHAYKKNITSNSFVPLSRVHTTAVDSSHELINGESGIKGEARKILQK